MKVVTVVQARTRSSRLPAKVLADVVGAPMLARQLARIRAARTPFDLVVATTADASDDPIVDLCRALDVRCFRGHPTDLLDRHVRAAQGADVVVKIPSDCPLIDPAIIDRVLSTYLAEPWRWDYVSNLHPATWPDGNDVEVMTMEALVMAQREAKAPHEREHTTPFLWDQPERFRVGNVLYEGGDLSMQVRLTVDYPEDLALVRAVFGALGADRAFGLEEILALFDRDPTIPALNALHNGVNWYRHHLHELRTIDRSQTRSAS